MVYVAISADMLTNLAGYELLFYTEFISCSRSLCPLVDVKADKLFIFCLVYS